MSDPEDIQGDRGFALLAVLGFMLLFAMVLAPFAAASRVKALTASYEYDNARLSAAAAAINGYLAWRLANDTGWRQSFEAGGATSMECAIGDVGVWMSLVPHAALIHLNTAEEPLLKAGFEKMGLGHSDAESLAAKIRWFRAPRPVEGEDASGVDGGLKHAPFEDISELHDFEALRRFALSDLARAFSVHSGRTILSVPGENPGLSEAYTMETVLFDGDVRGSDAAIFSLGDGAAAGLRMATIEAGRPERPEQVGRSCAAVLDPDVAGLLAEVLA